MSDRELLELAAKAAGVEYECTAHTGYPEDDQHQIRNEAGTLVDWNPLENDGDALRLAVRLNMGISIHHDYCAAVAQQGALQGESGMAADAATRRVIVRAAAAQAQQEAP